MKEICCRYTQDLVCPHCGYTFEYSLELMGDDGEVECHECRDCGEAFWYVTNTEITFSSSKHQEEE